MIPRDKILSSALRLHAHLGSHFVEAGLVRGPDAGVRFNLRLWRFLKSLLGSRAWRDQCVFMQTQGYWVLANWMLHEETGQPRFRELAKEATEATLRLQRPDGSWAYPLPERRHLVATVEGNWGAIALLATHTREPHREFLEGAVRWYAFLVNRIGFQTHGAGKAINYFDQPRGKLPNNSVEAAWFFLRLWKATGKDCYLEHVEALLDFMASVPRPSGELPYIVESPYETAREHYLCFQYNAFQFLKLAWADRLKPHTRAREILPKLARFLEKGVEPNGACRADCFHARPEVDYYTAVLAAALRQAAECGLTASAEPSERAYARLLLRQRADGSFAYSQGDYGFLSDTRPYPRPMTMTLFHLLFALDARDGFPPG